MRPLVLVAVFVAGAMSLSAATLSDAKILEASTNIKYLTQNIAKNYLYLYAHPQKRDLQSTVQRSIQELEKNIRAIAVNTNKAKIKGILDFIAYEKEQVKAIIAHGQSAENANEVLDFSEAVTEGAEKIASSVNYSFSFEEKMFLRSKNIEYLVEKLAKYYVVMDTDLDKATIKEKLQRTIELTDEDMAAIKQYVYPKSFETQKKDVFSFWNTNKNYLTKVDSLKVPGVVLISTNGMQSVVKKLAIHHAKGE